MVKYDFDNAALCPSNHRKLRPDDGFLFNKIKKTKYLVRMLTKAVKVIAVAVTMSYKHNYLQH